MSLPTSSVPTERVTRSLRAIGRELALRESEDTFGFSLRLRRIVIVYVCATLPVITLAGGLARDRTSYIVVFTVVASLFYATPALILTWVAVQRAPAPERHRWVLWSWGVTVTYLVGWSIFIGLVTGWRFANGPIGIAVVVGSNVLFLMSLLALVRMRSGSRVLSVDIIESTMSIVVLLTPAALIWGEDIVNADDAWFTVPASIATLGLVGGFYWTVVLLVRLGPAWSAIDLMGLGLSMFGSVNGVAQIAQGVSGFTLPGPPLVLLHALTMAFLLFIPLHISRAEAVGLERLPPQAQVRGAGLAAAVTLVGLPVVLVVTLAVHEDEPWAMGFTLGAVAVLVVLAAMRQLLAVRETKFLYAQVERASEERRDLLAQVVQRADEDRHRVATRLHQQAVAGYTRFVSFVQALSRGTADAAPEDSLARASDLLRDDLAQQAESLRQLMLAIRPLTVEPRRSESLATVIRAYVDSLYRDSSPPQLTVEIDDDLVLDWVDETVALRIVQEAIRNVWRHSGARHVDVSMWVDDAVAQLQIVDDGVGFDIDAKLEAAERLGSGLAAMRSFTILNGGRLKIESEPGRGTKVTAWMGESDVEPAPQPVVPPDGSRRLRLVASEGRVTDLMKN